MKKIYLITSLVAFLVTVGIMIVFPRVSDSSWYGNTITVLATVIVAAAATLLTMGKYSQNFVFHWKKYFFYFFLPYILFMACAIGAIIMYIAWSFAKGDF